MTARRLARAIDRRVYLGIGLLLTFVGFAVLYEAIFQPQLTPDAVYAPTSVRIIQAAFACVFFYLGWRLTKPCRTYRASQRAKRAGRCAKCGYDLRGSASDACPECGADHT